MTTTSSGLRRQHQTSHTPLSSSAPHDGLVAADDVGGVLSVLGRDAWRRMREVLRDFGGVEEEERESSEVFSNKILLENKTIRLGIESTHLFWSDERSGTDGTRADRE